jgi:hypothetical protein
VPVGGSGGGQSQGVPKMPMNYLQPQPQPQSQPQSMYNPYPSAGMSGVAPGMQSGMGHPGIYEVTQDI